MVVDYISIVQQPSLFERVPLRIAMLNTVEVEFSGTPFPHRKWRWLCGCMDVHSIETQPRNMAKMCL